jgi:hypothetical protein
MRNRHEPLSFDLKEWACVSVQSPLGAIRIARRLPVAARRAAKRVRPDAGTIRRFAPSSPAGLIMRRVRLRRSL